MFFHGFTQFALLSTASLGLRTAVAELRMEDTAGITVASSASCLGTVAHGRIDPLRQLTKTHGKWPLKY